MKGSSTFLGSLKTNGNIFSIGREEGNLQFRINLSKVSVEEIMDSQSARIGRMGKEATERKIKVTYTEQLTYSIIFFISCTFTFSNVFNHPRKQY